MYVETTRYVERPVFCTTIRTADSAWSGPELHADSFEEAEAQARELKVVVEGALDTVSSRCNHCA